MVTNSVVDFCGTVTIFYGSGSDFWTSYVSGYASQKVTVPTVPVPAPYLDHLKQIKKILPFYIVSFFTR